MPIFLEGSSAPDRWADHKAARAISIVTDSRPRLDGIRIALVNNMPDAALEDTEAQFFTLLDAAAGRIRARIRLYTLPGVPRTERGRQHLSCLYSEFRDLWTRQFDAIIVTGTEPCTPRLSNEPYWPQIKQLIDWAERNTITSVWSCLAAHASVLQGDGIERRRLSNKKFGVFEVARIVHHPLTRLEEKIRFPHSRWNELPGDALLQAGYTILTESPSAGVDSFIKIRKNSLFLHFQGHPEYEAMTLFKEYRRDIRRFLKGEREDYPSMPKDYFDTSAAKILSDFQSAALSHRHENQMRSFPEESILPQLVNGWQSCAISIYRNWLHFIAERRREVSAFRSRSVIGDPLYGEPSAIR
jgi:homoserine O-succinyltransferase